MLPDPRIAQTVLYATLGGACTLALAVTLWRHPLIQWRTRDTAWLRAWLSMTVLDYYGAALVLGGVAVSEFGPAEGLAWLAAVCLLGAPACCAYAVRRAWAG